MGRLRTLSFISQTIHLGYCQGKLQAISTSRTASGAPVTLIPWKNGFVPLFPKSKSLFPMFSVPQIAFFSLFPSFLDVCSLGPLTEMNALVPLFPKTPGRASTLNAKGYNLSTCFAFWCITQLSHQFLSTERAWTSESSRLLARHKFSVHIHRTVTSNAMWYNTNFFVTKNFLKKCFLLCWWAWFFFLFEQSVCIS